MHYGNHATNASAEKLSPCHQLLGNALVQMNSGSHVTRASDKLSSLDWRNDYVLMIREYIRLVS